jgi:Effector protein
MLTVRVGLCLCGYAGAPIRSQARSFVHQHTRTSINLASYLGPITDSGRETFQILNICHTNKSSTMHKSLQLVFFLILSLSLTAQNEPLQPFEDLGIKVKVLTLSNGKYQESFPNDTLIQIGSVMFNRITGQIESVVITDTLYSEYSLQPEVVSRWLSIDPLAAKYPDYSPYNFAIDNPIIFVDPDGQDIIIAIKGTGDDFATREMYFGQLKLLTNDELAMDVKGNITIVKKKEGGRHDGTLLIRNLIEGVSQDDGSVKEYTVTIVNGIGNGTVAVDASGANTTDAIANSQNGTGTSSKVIFDINNEGNFVLNQDGTTGRPTQLGLAHELIHAENNMQGVNENNIETDVIDPDDKKGEKKLSKEELKVRNRENLIRKEQKWKKRKMNT